MRLIWLVDIKHNHLVFQFLKKRMVNRILIFLLFSVNYLYTVIIMIEMMYQTDSPFCKIYGRNTIVIMINFRDT